jgi:queuine/archaeosine tRNA-ribosyltransferase
MTLGIYFAVLVAVILGVHLFDFVRELRATGKDSGDLLADLGRKLKNFQIKLEYGPINEAMICPHCQTKGNVRTKAVERKDGISGGKAAAAILLSPLTLLATGLSRMKKATQAYCDNCKSTWDF